MQLCLGRRDQNPEKDGPIGHYPASSKHRRNSSSQQIPRIGQMLPATLPGSLRSRQNTWPSTGHTLQRFTQPSLLSTRYATTLGRSRPIFLICGLHYPRASSAHSSSQWPKRPRRTGPRLCCLELLTHAGELVTRPSYQRYSRAISAPQYLPTLGDRALVHARPKSASST
jgi:hypothetical protein